jgi:hypothetical protein
MLISIKYKHPVWRRLLFPFYSIKEVITVAILLFSVMLLVRFVQVGDEFTFVLLGYIGAVVAAFGASPAVLSGDCLSDHALESLLKEKGFVRSNGKWAPPLPAFLRSPHNFVKINNINGRLEVRGPHNILRFIDRELNIGGR